MTYFVAFICVLGIAGGQILFKVSALTLKLADNIFDFKGLAILAASLCLYALTTIAWVWVLQRLELGRVYPLMAIAFILVPLASQYFLGERFSIQYGIGVGFIVLGIVITIWS